MPRMLRLECPGSLIHIIARGIDRSPIFHDEEDRQQFIHRFSRHRAEVGFKCLAWCLMPNHYHFLLRLTEFPPSNLMRPLNAGYARWFNRKYGRCGYLFQDRYKSILCQDSGYSMELIRYIHLNPMRAGLVSTLDELPGWKWSGHGFVLGVKAAPGEQFQDRAEALRRFGQSPQAAAEAYLEFLSEGLTTQAPCQIGALHHREAFEVAGSDKGWPAVIGDPEFARQAMSRHEVARWRRHRQADYHAVLQRLAIDTAAEHGLERAALFSRGKADSRSAARAAFCRRAHFDELIPYAVIARFLGTTIPPVAILAKRAAGWTMDPGKK